MEEITERVGTIGVNAGESQKTNRIQVSSTKKPLFFYVNLGKRYMQQYNEVELSALGMAIATVVSVAEILKNNGLDVEKKIMTSTVDFKDDSKGRPVSKAKIEIVLVKSENFGEVMAATAEKDRGGDGEVQKFMVKWKNSKILWEFNSHFDTVRSRVKRGKMELVSTRSIDRTFCNFGVGDSQVTFSTMVDHSRGECSGNKQIQDKNA